MALVKRHNKTAGIMPLAKTPGERSEVAVAERQNGIAKMLVSCGVDSNGRGSPRWRSGEKGRFGARENCPCCRPMS